MRRGFLLVMTIWAALLWAQEGEASPDGSAQQAAPQNFVHAQRKYVLFAPPGARFVKKGGKIDISIQSPKGYAVSVQTGDSKPEIKLDIMIAKLEALYLGKGKAWSNKIGGGVLSVAGLPARDAVYAGGNSRTRVVIVRGRATDFVFIYLAPPRVFEALSFEFDWVLENFRPAPQELGAAAPLKKAPQAPGPRKFDEPGFGFTIEYPNDWIMEKPSKHVVMFSGRAGTDAYSAVVSVSNVKQSGAVGPAAAVKAAAGLKAQIAAAATGVQYLKEGPFSFDFNGMKIEGRELLAVYVRQGRKFRKWILAAPRPNGGAKADIVHIWSYVAPETQFDRFKPIAESMRKSWRFSG
ncbi:MAG TPA: hypothetical protein ENI79_04405 [Rhodospirillales bacterium]|nr:hypothetical protein [Rhodospirillales bacterium]